MELQDLIHRFSGTQERQERAIFSSLFILCNRLQTLFDSRIPSVTLRQFMLLSIVHQGDEAMTFTQLGTLLGCSRQNVKKLALALEKKGFVTISPSPDDARASCLRPTEKTEHYFQKTFVPYQQELRWLFEVYTPQEVDALFRLLMKLYAGLARLEEKTQGGAI